MKEKAASNQFNFRMDPPLRDQLAKACEVTREEASTVVRCCIEAYVAAVERDAEITKPFAIVSKKKLAALESAKGVSSVSGIPLIVSPEAERASHRNEPGTSPREIAPPAETPPARITRSRASENENS